jgi:hypothetical protein
MAIGNYQIFFGAECEVAAGEDYVQLLCCRASIQGRNLDLSDIPFGHALPILEMAIGPFLYIEIQKEVITIGSSLCRSYDIFLAMLNGAYVVASDLNALLEVNGCIPDLNKQYCLDFLGGREEYGGETPFLGIEHVVLGGFYKLSRSGIDKNFLNPTKTLDIKTELAKVVAGNIKAVSDVAEKKYLHFSGGLDSSLIFASMMEANIDFTPLHSLPGISEDNSELEVAEGFCGLYSKKLIHICGKGSVKLAPYQFQGYNFASDVPFFLHDEASRPYMAGCAFSGIGGDAVFLQNPPLVIGVPYLKRLKIAQALRMLMDLARLKRLNFIKLLGINIAASLGWNVRAENTGTWPRWLSPQRRARRAASHPLLNGHSPTLPKFHHLRAILANLYAFKQGDGIGASEFAPLLFQNMVAIARQESYEGSFTSIVDRKMIREQLRQIVPAAICDRSQKRPSSDLYFNMLSESSAEFKYVLLNSRLIRFLQIDKRELLRSIDSNVTVALDDDLQYLERLYKLDLYLRSVPDRLFEENCS